MEAGAPIYELFKSFLSSSDSQSQLSTRLDQVRVKTSELGWKRIEDEWHFKAWDEKKAIEDINHSTMEEKVSKSLPLVEVGSVAPQILERQQRRPSLCHTVLDLCMAEALPLSTTVLFHRCVLPRDLFQGTRIRCS